MLIRDARRADVPAIVALYADDVRGRGRETPSDTLPDVYWAAFDALAADPGQTLLVGEVDGRVVATLQLTLTPGLSHRGATRATVEAVRVASALRGGGLGGALMRHAVGLARAKGARTMQLTSNAARADAHRFYVRLGFAQSHAGFKLEL